MQLAAVDTTKRGICRQRQVSNQPKALPRQRSEIVTPLAVPDDDGVTAAQTMQIACSYSLTVAPGTSSPTQTTYTWTTPLISFRNFFCSYILFMPSVPVGSMCHACMRFRQTSHEKCTTGCSRNWRCVDQTWCREPSWSTSSGYLQAATNVFSVATVNGCFYHLWQNILRKIQTQGLQVAYQTTVTFKNRPAWSQPSPLLR